MSCALVHLQLPAGAWHTEVLNNTCRINFRTHGELPAFSRLLTWTTMFFTEGVAISWHSSMAGSYGGAWGRGSFSWGFSLVSGSDTFMPLKTPKQTCLGVNLVAAEWVQGGRIGP